MNRMQSIHAREMISFLESKGFVFSRQKGSHMFFRHPDGRTATVPNHPGDDLGRGLIHKILKDCESTIDELLTWLKK